jgi:purine-binding chemotaxis protein CheW
MNPAGQVLLVFQLDAQRYALHLAAVLRVLPMMAIEPLPGAPAVIAGIINVGGQVLPVLDARRRFGLPGRDARLSDVLVLVRARSRLFALAADGVIGLIERDLAQVTPAASLSPDTRHVAGVVKLDDGLALIHDVETFLVAAEQARLDEALMDALTDEPPDEPLDAPADAPADAFTHARADPRANPSAGPPATGRDAAAGR